MRISSICRYPVKGFSPERLDRVQLARGAYVPGDRMYAIENGPSGFDPSAVRHQPKIKFLMLMRNEALARLRTRYDDETRHFDIEAPGHPTFRADLSTGEGRLALEAFIRRILPGELRGPPKVLTAPDGFRFTDSRTGYVSIINLASVASIGSMAGRPLDPLRFRGNVMVDGLAPWEEFDLVGRVVESTSGVRLKVTKRIVRCAATNVDPGSGARDVDLPALLQRRLGHADCGVYAEIMAGGDLAAGDTFTVVTDRQGSLAV